MTKTRVVVLFAFDGCQLLDVAGPASVFGVANSISGLAAYDVKVVSAHGGQVTASCGVTIAALAPAAVSPASIDTILVAGGGVAAMRDGIKLPAAQRWLKRCMRAARRFGSVCSGAHILAELGTVQGLRIATHWASCDALAKEFPDLSVDSEALFVTSGRVWTSAGVSTGIDMTLAMIEQDMGRPLANSVARFLVLYARRPGYQSQFSEVLNVQAAAGSQFSELASWLQGHLSKRIDVASLATKCGLSERTFYRKFAAATGQTPSQFVERVRLDAARTLLSTGLPLKTIAARTGLGTAVRLNAAFLRKFGLSASDFRKIHHGKSVA